LNSSGIGIMMTTLDGSTRPAIMLGAWVLWVLPFVLGWRGRSRQAAEIDSSARWGVWLEMLGFFAVNLHGPRTWSEGIAVWRAVAGAAFAVLAIVMVWSARRNLGRQWRIDAGLNADHELVRTGAYRIVRHPIYASMLGMLVATAWWGGTLPGWPIGLVLFLAGTEIRIRVEDELLRSRFGDEFLSWQKAVPAWLPFIR